MCPTDEFSFSPTGPVYQFLSVVVAVANALPVRTPLSMAMANMAAPSFLYLMSMNSSVPCACSR